LRQLVSALRLRGDIQLKTAITSENADGNLVAPYNSEDVDSYYLFGRRFFYRSALYFQGRLRLIGGGGLTAAGNTIFKTLKGQ